MRLRSWERSLSTATCVFFGARFPHVTTPQQITMPQQTPTPHAAAVLLQARMSQQITMPQAATARPQARMPQQARTPIKRVSFRPSRNVAPRALLQ